jgi:hypothetical protein
MPQILREEVLKIGKKKQIISLLPTDQLPYSKGKYKK